MPRLLLFLLLMSPVLANDRAGPGETVVLLHGLGRTRWSFYRLERTLRADGYTVVNRTYPSRARPVEDLARDFLGPLVAEQAGATRLHFVTHSMGGIVLRSYVHDHPVPNLGRVVMLAPPNGGSELADRLIPTWIYRTMNGPAGQQLGTAGLPTRLGPWPAGAGELGIIAGNVSLNPLFSAALPGENDGKVAVARARLAGMKDFLVVPNSHTWLAWRGPVIAQIQTFLRTGAFDHAGSQT